MSDRGQHTPSPADTTPDPAETTADPTHTKLPAETAEVGVDRSAGTELPGLDRSPSASTEPPQIGHNPILDHDEPIRAHHPSKIHHEPVQAHDLPSEIHDEPVQAHDEPIDLDEADEKPETPVVLAAPNRTRKIVLMALLAITLAGAATLAYIGIKISSQRHATLATPAQIGDLQLDTSEEATTTADYLQTALSAEVDFDKSVGAIYTGADDKNVLFFGGTALIWSPEKQLDAAFELIADEQGAVTGLHDVDPGEFGGTMQCGTSESPEADLTICGWADHGSLALAMFPDRAEADAARLLREIRKTTQTRD